VMKTYIAKVEGRVTPQTIAKLTSGIDLEDGAIAADKAKIVGQAGNTETLVEVTLHSGRNRIVRRMLEAVGHPVVDLVRRQFGPLHLGSLREGDIRDLTKAELGQLLTISRAAKAGDGNGTAADADASGESAPEETSPGETSPGEAE
jgi:16S rRNA U516 pseudouridylate synthase RsuA-like enzyme